MNKCLQCEKEYKAKRPTRKFCSANCRIKYYRAHKREIPTQKDAVGKVELEVLYNKILDLVGNIEKPNIPIDYVEERKDTPDRNIEFYSEQQIDVTFPMTTKDEVFRTELKKCKDKKSVNRVVSNIKDSDLGWRIKLDLEREAVEISENFYDD